jgi:hypothetical protein
MQISLQDKKSFGLARAAGGSGARGGAGSRLGPGVVTVIRSGLGGRQRRLRVVPMRGGLAVVPQWAKEAGGGTEWGDLAWGVHSSVRQQ